MTLVTPSLSSSTYLPAAATTTNPDRWRHLLPETWTLPTVLHWVLRVAMLWCFVGHGAFGIIGKAGWLPYYHVLGVSDSLAWDTMPLIGAMDIAIGIVTLFRPMRAVLVYAIGWTTMTALLRPLAGQGLWQEVAERGGNFGIPIALLILVGLGDRSLRSWFESARPRQLTDDVRQWLAWSLRICIALLLIGHGGFGVTHLHDKEWTSYLGVLGLAGDTVDPGRIFAIGLVEIALGIAVLVKPWRELIVFVLVWKVFTELLRPLSGEPIWEFIERGGDWFLPIALLAMQVMRRDNEVRFTVPATAGVKAATVGFQPTTQARWRATASVPVTATTFVANGNGHGHVNGHISGHVNGTGPRMAPTPEAVSDDDLLRAGSVLAARIAAQRQRLSRT